MSLKEDILKHLKGSSSYVSGQELSDQLGVSRTAIWKAIGRLKEEGYPIVAVQNRGYLLDDEAAQDSDVLNQAELEERLAKCTTWAGHPVFYKEETGSTNDDVMALADEGAPEGTLVVANRQTRGKGRRGRSWESPDEGNIYMSFLIRPKMSTDIVPMVTIVMALAMCEACNEICGTDPDWGGTGDAKTGPLTGETRETAGTEAGLLTDSAKADPLISVREDREIRFGIKWPNDIVAWNSTDPTWKKMVGILTELRLEEREIKDATIGTGVNVNRTEFPEELRNTATSMKLATGRTVNRADVIAATWRHFEEAYGKFVAAGSLAPLKEQYEKLLVNRDRAVRVLDPQEPYTGMALGINEQGELLVSPDAGQFPDDAVRAVYAGEVSVRGVEGYV